MRSAKIGKLLSEYTKQICFYVKYHHERAYMKFQNQLCSFGGEQALIVKRPRKMPFLRNLKKERFLHGCFGLFYVLESAFFFFDFSGLDGGSRPMSSYKIFF